MASGAPVRQRVGLVLLWVVAAGLAVAVGVAAVSGLGDQIRDRGPMGDNELVREIAQRTTPATPDTAAPRTEKTFTGDFGEFVVACQGKFASWVEGRPDRAAGWRLVSYEPEPDDDIDALFTNGRVTQELEVYCNLGEPVLAEIELDTLLGDDSDSGTDD